VNKLRQVLGDTPEQPVFVETIPRKGYSFVAKIEYMEQLPLKDSHKAISEADAKTTETTFATSRWFAGTAASKWFCAGVIALVIAAILLGAAITLYSYRGI
jgi:hypothetical protein